MHQSADKTWLWEQQNPRIQQLFFVLCAIFLVGLFFSPALVSIVPAIMFVLALSQGLLKERIQFLKKNRSAFGLLAVYGLLAGSFIYTEDQRNWALQMYRYAALLFLPAAGALLPPFREKQVYTLLYFFLLFATGVTIGTISQYVAHIDAQNELIIYSQSPPTINRIFHIHFGIMMALAIFFGAYIFRSPVLLWRKPEKYLAIVCVLILLVSIHVLAYRTGLLALYVTMAVGLYRFIKNQKRYLLGGTLLILLLMAPVAAYFSFESVQLRVANTRYDISRYTEHQDINYFSVSQRLAAWETAFSIIKRNWLVGVGPADIKLEMQRQYDIKDFGLKEENQVMIHNQYLHILVGSGIMGLLVFLYPLVYSFWRLARQKDFCATSFLLIMCSAMLVDSFFELQRGLNLFVFFYMLLIIRQEQRILVNESLLAVKTEWTALFKRS